MELLIFLFLMLIGAPIAVAIALMSFYAMFENQIAIDIFARNIFSGIDSFTLMAIPFFIFAGNLMHYGGVSKRIIKFAQNLVGWMTGGLPIAGVLSSMLFASLSGSSPATVAAIGNVMIPTLNESGYSKNFSVGLVTASGSLGIIIPPSITFLVYGSSAEVSIGDLFIAGILPGVFIGLLLIVMSFIIAKKENHQPEKRASIHTILKSFKDAIWGILLPIIVLGGIYVGIFTPTEAAAVAIVYSFVIGTFVYKDLKWREMFNVARSSVVTSTMIMFVIAASSVFNWYLTFENIPSDLANVFLEYANTKIAFIFLVILILLIVGMFMDTSAAVLIFVPLFLPLISEFGIDPIHFGVIMITTLAIGMLTPPFGLNLFVASGITGYPFLKVVRGTIPFIFVLIIAAVVIAFVPLLSLLLL